MTVWQKRTRQGAILTAIGAAMSVMDPYGATTGLPAWAGFLYWTGLIVAGYALGVTAHSLLRRHAPFLPAWAALAAISLITAIGGTAAVFAVHVLWMPEPIPAAFLPTLFGLVWVIAAAMTGIGYLLDRSGLTEPAEPGQTGEPVRDFLERLPLKYRNADLYAVSAEDHYLRVHTSLGEALILLRLADAMRELSGAEGLQVHRSWWVARAGVTDTRRRGGRLSLVLASGTEAPVSRTFLPAVKAAGLAV